MTWARKAQTTASRTRACLAGRPSKYNLFGKRSSMHPWATKNEQQITRRWTCRHRWVRRWPCKPDKRRAPSLSRHGRQSNGSRHDSQVCPNICTTTTRGSCGLPRIAEDSMWTLPLREYNDWSRAKTMLSLCLRFTHWIVDLDVAFHLSWKYSILQHPPQTRLRKARPDWLTEKQRDRNTDASETEKRTKQKHQEGQ